MGRPAGSLGNIQASGHSLIAICRREACRYSREVDIRRLSMRVGTWASPVPDAGSPHFSDQMRCPSCKRRGMNLWLIPKVVAREPDVPSNPNFRVIDHGKTDPYTFEMIATANNLMVARGAYVAAALFYPDRWITLMQGAFVMNDSRQEGPPKPMDAEDFAAMREAEYHLAHAPGPARAS